MTKKFILAPLFDKISNFEKDLVSNSSEVTVDENLPLVVEDTSLASCTFLQQYFGVVVPKTLIIDFHKVDFIFAILAILEKDCFSEFNKFFFCSKDRPFSIREECYSPLRLL